MNFKLDDYGLNPYNIDDNHEIQELTTKYILNNILDKTNGLIGDTCHVIHNRKLKDIYVKLMDKNMDNEKNFSLCEHDDCFYDCMGHGDKYVPNFLYKNEQKILKYHIFNFEVTKLLQKIINDKAYKFYELMVNEITKNIIIFLKNFAEKHGKIRYLYNVSSNDKYISILVYYNRNLCDDFCREYDGYTSDTNNKIPLTDICNLNLNCKICHNELSLNNIHSFSTMICKKCFEHEILIQKTVNKIFSNSKNDIINSNEKIKSLYNEYDNLGEFTKNHIIKIFEKNSNIEFRDAPIEGYQEKKFTLQEFIENSYHVNIYNFIYTSDYKQLENNKIYIKFDEINIYIYIYKHNYELLKNILFKKVRCRCGSSITHMHMLPLSSNNENNYLWYKSLIKYIQNYFQNDIDKTNYDYKQCHKCFHKENVMSEIKKIIINNVMQIIKNNPKNINDETIYNLILSESIKLDLNF